MDSEAEQLRQHLFAAREVIAAERDRANVETRRRRAAEDGRRRLALRAKRWRLERREALECEARSVGEYTAQRARVAELGAALTAKDAHLERLLGLVEYEGCQCEDEHRDDEPCFPALVEAAAKAALAVGRVVA